MINRIICVMHVPIEGPGMIAGWAKRKGIPIHYLKPFEKADLIEPKPDDLLLIMGGPMNVYDYHVTPWSERGPWSAGQWASSWLEA